MVDPFRGIPYSFRALSKTYGLMWARCDVCRRYVRLKLAGLQRAGLIRCGHGHVDIVNRPGLEAMACECYAALRHDLEVLFAFPYRHLWRATK